MNKSNKIWNDTICTNQLLYSFSSVLILHLQDLMVHGNEVSPPVNDLSMINTKSIIDTRCFNMDWHYIPEYFALSNSVVRNIMGAC